MQLFQSTRLWMCIGLFKISIKTLVQGLRAGDTIKNLTESEERRRNIASSAFSEIRLILCLTGTRLVFHFARTLILHLD